MKKLRIPKALKNKKLVLAIIGSTLIATAGVSAYTVNQSSGGASEEPPIVTEINRQGEQLENHEGRITNAENDISNLQENTNTAPSTNRVEVRPNPGSASSPVSSPVKVVSYTVLPNIPQEFTECRYNYSDGTTFTFKWRYVVTDANGNKTTKTVGRCDDSVIGTLKN